VVGRGRPLSGKALPPVRSLPTETTPTGNVERVLAWAGMRRSANAPQQDFSPDSKGTFGLKLRVVDSLDAHDDLAGNLLRSDAGVDAIAWCFSKLR
jgi:hypothetical protein